MSAAGQTLAELHRRKDELTNAVREAVQRWEDETGLRCSRLEIEHHDVTQIGDDAPRWKVAVKTRCYIGDV